MCKAGCQGVAISNEKTITQLEQDYCLNRLDISPDKMSTSHEYQLIGSSKPDKTRTGRKVCFRLLLLVLVFCVLLLVFLIYSLIDTIKLNRLQKFQERISNKVKTVKNLVMPTSGVRELKSQVEMATEYEMLQKSVYVFDNVCLESAKNQTYSYILPKRTAYYNVTKRIVVYGHWGSSNRSLPVGGSPNSVFNRWDISMVSDAVPQGYTMSEGTAFFVVQTCPGNLHHFWEDEFKNLYSTVAKIGGLEEGAPPNHILYKLPPDIAPEDIGCFNITTYAPLLKTLNIDDFHDVFYRYPDKTCFRRAVFGVANFSPNVTRAANKHVMKSYNIDTSTCKRNQLTIIQRNYRRILNPEDLLKAAKDAGFTNASVVNLGDLSVLEQVRTAVCACVLVGVQGAGLQWSTFMRENSSLIEVAWPRKHWASYFTTWVKPYNIKHYDLDAQVVRLNWPAYQKKVLMGKQLTQEEKKILQQNEPKSALDNIWKWADILVNELEFKNMLLPILYDLSN